MARQEIAVKPTPPKKLGRPPKLTAEMQEKIVLLIMEEGSYAQVAAQVAGIPERRFYDWMEKGEGERAKEPYKSFHQAIKKASAIAESKASKKVFTGKSDWISAATWLERTRRERWSRSDKFAVDVSGSVIVEVVNFAKHKAIEVNPVSSKAIGPPKDVTPSNEESDR
jgi:hypothetical protein